MCFQDPPPTNWSQDKLPNTWPDELKFSNPKDLFYLLNRVLGKRQKVILPEPLPELLNLPSYLLVEFHNLPNGNYSKHIAKGYISGFDLVMLGRMKKARQEIAKRLAHCKAVLDVGCGGGKLAATLKRKGVPEVWGLDPSPYLLQHASHRFPKIPFVQGLAENTRFPAQRFDGIGVCFLFHELPKDISDQSLKEFYRILKPGGLLAIIEPSPEQLQEKSIWKLFQNRGFGGLYFGFLAQKVYEPFVKQWHERNIREWLETSNFKLLEDQNEMPFRLIFAQKNEDKET